MSKEQNYIAHAQSSTVGTDRFDQDQSKNRNLHAFCGDTVSPETRTHANKLLYVLSRTSKYQMSFEPRPLTTEENHLVYWLLRHGKDGAEKYLKDLELAKVSGKCQCGCASVDFSINGKSVDSPSGMVIVSDYLWRTENNALCGCFVFIIEDQLAGLEVYSVDGKETPIKLPLPSQLQPLENSNDV